MVQYYILIHNTHAEWIMIIEMCVVLLKHKTWIICFYYAENNVCYTPGIYSPPHSPLHPWGLAPFQTQKPFSSHKPLPFRKWCPSLNPQPQGLATSFSHKPSRTDSIPWIPTQGTTTYYSLSPTLGTDFISWISTPRGLATSHSPTRGTNSISRTPLLKDWLLFIPLPQEPPLYPEPPPLGTGFLPPQHRTPSPGPPLVLFSRDQLDHAKI